MSNILNLKLDCYILNSDPLWIFRYDNEEFPTKLKAHTLNTAHTHTPTHKKKISQAPQPEDRKRANYFRVLILNISQEAMKKRT